jgi:hypothetical protein
MSTASRLFLCTVLWLLCVPGAIATPSASASSEPGPLAQSALLTVRATVSGEWLILHILHAGDQSPVVSKDVSVSVAGHPVPVTPLGNGTYSVPLRQLGSSREPILDVTVGHDGIREIVSGKTTLAAAPTRSSGSRQYLWWVLNIAIVFVAAMLFARRKPPQKDTEGSD